MRKKSRFRETPIISERPFVDRTKDHDLREEIAKRHGLKLGLKKTIFCTGKNITFTVGGKILTYSDYRIEKLIRMGRESGILNLDEVKKLESLRELLSEKGPEAFKAGNPRYYADLLLKIETLSRTKK